MRPGPSSRTEGVALTVVLIIITVLSLLVWSVLALAYNQKLMVDRVNARHTRAEARAQAGLVNARWRIRTNFGREGGYEPATDPDAY